MKAFKFYKILITKVKYNVLVVMNILKNNNLVISYIYINISYNLKKKIKNKLFFYIY
jgi:hypothetical protein